MRLTARQAMGRRMAFLAERGIRLTHEESGFSKKLDFWGQAQETKKPQVKTPAARGCLIERRGDQAIKPEAQRR
jgi:hypothetical protein